MKLFGFDRQITADEVKVFIERVTVVKFDCEFVFDKRCEGSVVRSMIGARG
jgi:hypothetical protein